MHRPPQENNKYTFFKELNETLSKAVNSYKNIIVIGDLNIDVSDPDKDRNNYLFDFVDTFSLSNLINGKTCHKNLPSTTIDLDLILIPHLLDGYNWIRSDHPTNTKRGVLTFLYI